MNRSSTAVRLLLAAVLTTTVLATPAPTAAARGRADLQVADVQAPRKVRVGERLRLKAVVANTGRRRARATRLDIHLSRDRRLQRSDVRLAREKVPRLRPGQRREVRMRVRIPASVEPRRYRLLVCADANDRVRERSERDNCAHERLKLRPDLTEPPEPDPSDEPTFPLDPDPLTVSSTVEDHNASTRFALGFADTTFSVTADDGTTYTLTVPAGALLGNVEITMTPVSTVGGLPLSGGLAAGVRIEPHGLLLQKPATLVIEGSDLGPAAQQTGFHFHDGGEDFHLYPLLPPAAGDDADTVRMSITHFSTPGVALGTPADRQAALAHPPVRTRDQAAAMVSELLRAERESQLAGNPPDPATGEHVLDVLRAYYDDVLRSELAAAEADAALAAETIAEALGWARSISLIGGADDPRIDEVWQRIERILRNAVDHYWRACSQDHELGAISMLVALARQAALLGLPFADEALDKARRCAQVDVEFTSRITSESHLEGDTQDAEGSALWAVSGTASIEGTGRGSGVLDYDDFSYHHRIDYPPTEFDCVEPNHHTVTTGVGTTPGSISAQFRFELDPRETPPGEPPAVRELRLAIFPGSDLDQGLSTDRPEETYRTESFSCDSSTSEITDPHWAWNFADLHEQSLILEVVGDPAEQQGDLLLTEVWDQDVENGPPTNYSRLTELTTVEVWHRPQV